MHLMLYVMKDLLNGSKAIAVRAMHVQISPAHFSGMMRLPLRHLPALPQHRGAGARIPGYSDHIVVYIPCHTIPSLIILPECEALAAIERRWQDGLVPN